MSLQPEEQVLLSYRNGDQRWRHAVLLGEADGTYHRIFAPARIVRRVDLASVDLDRIAAWDDVDPPLKLKGKDVFLDTDAAEGKIVRRRSARCLVVALVSMFAVRQLCLLPT